jgi:hypothetical protein
VAHGYLRLQFALVDSRGPVAFFHAGSQLGVAISQSVNALARAPGHLHRWCLLSFQPLGQGHINARRIVAVEVAAARQTGQHFHIFWGHA